MEIGPLNFLSVQDEEGSKEAVFISPYAGFSVSLFVYLAIVASRRSDVSYLGTERERESHLSRKSEPSVYAGKCMAHVWLSLSGVGDHRKEGWIQRTCDLPRFPPGVVSMRTGKAQACPFCLFLLSEGRFT